MSKSAVSRALSGQGDVSEANRARIERAAAGLGYVANAMARGLANPRTQTLGAVLRDMTRPFYGELLAGMQMSAENHGRQVITVTSATELEVGDALRNLKSLISLQVDGLVIASARLPSDDIVPFIDRTPIVVAGRSETSPGITSVFSDDIFGGAQIADHVMGLGHERIAVLLVDRTYSLSQHTRGASMIDAIRRSGRQVETWSLSEDADASAVIAHRIDTTASTAIMCPTDAAAVGALEIMRQRGLSAPADYTVTGYDGIGPLATPYLGLTTYLVPVTEMGRSAINLLVDKIDGRARDDRLLALRGSTVVGRTAGPPRPVL